MPKSVPKAYSNDLKELQNYLKEKKNYEFIQEEGKLNIFFKEIETEILMSFQAISFAKIFVKINHQSETMNLERKERML